MEFQRDGEPTEEKAVTTDADKEEIVIMELQRDGKPTEEKAFTTAVSRFSIAESHVANEESNPNISTLDSSRLESSELDHIVSQQVSNYRDHSEIFHDDLACDTGIDSDTSLNDQDGIQHQMQQPAGNGSDFKVEDPFRLSFTWLSWQRFRLSFNDHGFSYRFDVDDGFNIKLNVNVIDDDTARMQRMRLLKQYGFLKKELNWPDIISVAHNLHDDRYIKQHEMEQIKDGSQTRRKAIDTLLKIVLRNPSTVSAFMRILESKGHLLYMAEKINKTKISVERMERFQFQEQTRQHQSIYLETSRKFHFSDSDVDFLIHSLFEEEEVIDQISDSLLSDFYISICDHSEISDCAYMDDKILRLLDLMKKCPDGAHDIFIEVLTKNNLEHILDSLERNQMVNIKRKYSSCDDENPSAKKHMKIGHNRKISASDAVEKIASGLRIATARQKLRNEAIKHLDLEFNEAFGSSLGLVLSFKVGEMSQKLKHPFA